MMLTQGATVSAVVYIMSKYGVDNGSFVSTEEESAKSVTQTPVRYTRRSVRYVCDHHSD